MKFELNSVSGLDYKLTSLYEAVAAQMGEDPQNDNIRYDCRKINVAQNIMDKMRDSAIQTFADRANERDIVYEFNMMWCLSGPKAVDYLNDNEVEVEEGFINYE